MHYKGLVNVNLFITHGNHNCPDTVSPHASMMTNSDDFFATVNKLTSEARKKQCNRYIQFDPPFIAFPNTQNPCGAGNFVTDKMSGYGDIDFVAVDKFRNGYGYNDTRRYRYRGRWAGQNGGYYNHPECGGYPPHHRGGRRGKRGNFRRRGNGPEFLSECGESGPGPVGAVQRTFSPTGMDLGVEPDYISRKREKAKLRKRRRKALKAAAMAQMAQDAPDLHIIATVDEAAGATTETQQVKPEQEVRKRKERPAADNEPERKSVKTEPSGGDQTSTENSPNKMEAAERVITHRTASNPAAPGRSNAGHTEETNEDSTPAPASTSAAEGQSFMTYSTKPHSRRTRYKQRKQGYFGRTRIKITAQRLAFVCSVCKFRSFYRKNMTVHLQSQFHKDHFKFLSEHLPEATVDFLQSHFNNKHRKVESLINQIPNHRATICQLYEDQDLTQDISMEHFMRKAEAAHCLACDVYMPMQQTLIQKHLNSPDHKSNCKAMMVHSKDLGLSIAQSILSHRYIRKKLQLYLKDSVVTDGPEVKPEEAWSVGQRTAPETDMMSQEAESLCGQMNRAVERIRHEKDLEAEPCGQVNQAVERIRDEKDQEAEPCGQVNQAVERIRDEKDQEAEPCGQVNQAVERIKDEKDQEAEPCGQVNQAVERIRDETDQEAEPCGQVNQAVERIRDETDQEAESLCGQAVQAAGAVINGKEQQSEAVCEETVPAVETIKNEQEEPEQYHLTNSLFDLLHEEDDVEGVELGEEEMGEDDI
ncbi:hypothetical protein QTP86_028828 [Hemibagrus guttatus]|nr:hypothetical protein QTP86_028828 [Hemibagrus guttatus]